MAKELILHQPDYHPQVPSFADEYRDINHQVFSAIYAIVFVPGRQRYITGGVATQFYIPPESRRGSNDIDIQDLQRKTWPQFKTTLDQDYKLATVVNSLEGYEVGLIRENHSFLLHVCNWFLKEGDDRHWFNVEFSRHGNGYHQKLLPTLEREFHQTNQFTTSTADILVLDPVDIIARKAVRLNNYQKYEGVKVKNPPRDLEEHLNQIWKKRAKVNPLRNHVIEENCQECAPKYHLQHTELRALCDQYDIRAMLKYDKQIDQNYFEDVMKELSNRGYQRKEIDTVLNLLPEFSLG